MNIFNKDLTNAGGADGRKDAKEGKPKSHYGILKQPKAWILGPDGSYSKAYDRMYDKEQEHQANVYAPAGNPVNPTNPQSSQQASMSSYAYQIELLQDLKSHLQQFQERLLRVSENYQRTLDNLHTEGGLMDETYRDFVEQQLEPTQEKINQLVEHITGNDIPAVEKEIAFLEQRL